MTDTMRIIGRLDPPAFADERKRIIDALRQDNGLWAYLCGAIAPSEATTHAISEVLRLTASWLEKEAP